MQAPPKAPSGIPEATVLVTAYNRSRFLERALESACAQECSPELFEVILLSNVPAHGDVLRAVGERHPRHRLRFQLVGEMSIGEMLALGVEEAHGPVLCLLNDDDEWAPSKLTRVLSAFHKRPDLVYVWNGVQRISATGETLQTRGRFAASGRPSDEEEHVDGSHPSELARVLRWRSLGFNDSAISLRRDMVRAVLPRLRSLRTNEDSFLLYAAAISGRSMLFLSDRLTRYRVHGEGMSQSANTDESEAWTKLEQNDRRELASWEVIVDMAREHHRSNLLPLIFREREFTRLVALSRAKEASRGDIARGIVAFLPYSARLRRWPGALALGWSLLSLFSRSLSRRAYLVSVRVQSNR